MSISDEELRRLAASKTCATRTRLMAVELLAARKVFQVDLEIRKAIKTTSATPNQMMNLKLERSKRLDGYFAWYGEPGGEQ